MKQILFSVFAALAFYPSSVLCQEAFFDFDFSQMATPEIKSTMVGDSLFISYRKKTIGSDPTYMWISNDGKGRTVNLTELDKHELLGVVPSAKSTRYYFTEFEKNVNILKCLVFNKQTGEKALVDSLLTFEGSLIGSYFDTTLCFIVADRDFIRFFRTDGAEINESKFKLPQQLLKNKRTPVSFVPSGYAPGIEDGSVPVKFLLSDTVLYIIQDEPKHFQTTVHSITLRTGEVKSSLFLEPAPAKHFLSFVCSGKLYRVVDGKKVILQAFDLMSGHELHTQVLTERKRKTDYFAFTRNGLDRTVAAEWASGAIPKVSFFIATNVAKDVVLTVGTTYEIRESFMPIVFGSMAEVLVTLVANVAFRAIENPKLIHGYTHLRETPSSGFSFTDNSGLRMQQIDDYEKQFAPKQTKFLFKGYLAGKKYTYAFYQKLKLNRIEIVRFGN